jgi:hypothetical protein
MLARELANNPRHPYHLVAFVDDDPYKHGRRIHGVPVVGGIASLEKLLESGAGAVILTSNRLLAGSIVAATVRLGQSVESTARAGRRAVQLSGAGRRGTTPRVRRYRGRRISVNVFALGAVRWNRAPFGETAVQSFRRGRHGPWCPAQPTRRARQARASGTTVADGYFDSRLPSDPRREVLWRTLWRAYFCHLIRADDTVLDLGAGYCHFINNVRSQRRLAVDKWPGFAAWAAPGVEARVGDIGDLAWLADGSVDFVLASNVFEHLSKDALSRLLPRLREKLASRGRLCLIQPNYRYCSKEYFDDYTHVTVFSHVSIGDLLTAHGFRVLECRPRFLPLTVKSRLPVHPALIRAYLASPIRPGAKQMLVLAAPAPVPEAGTCAE